jgi:exopolysaccharide biosynthesis polyprenyl glycosylphosphotransferase
MVTQSRVRPAETKFDVTDEELATFPRAVPPVSLVSNDGGIAASIFGIDIVAWVLASSIAGWSHVDGPVVLVFVALAAMGGLYRSRLTLSVLEQAAQIVARAAAAGVIVSVALLLNDPSSRDRLAVTVAIAVPMVLLLRGLGYGVLRRLRTVGIIGDQTLILGAGRVGAQIADLMLTHPTYGLRPVGFLDHDPLLTRDERPVPLLGGSDVLAKTITDFSVRVVVVAFGALPESALVEVIRTCDRLKCEIFFVPRLFELHGTSHDVDHIRGLPLIRLRRAAFRSVSWRFKRVFDVIVSAFALLILSPVIAAIAIAVRLEDGPGIIFKQTRVGLDNVPFQVLKFRSLRPVNETESATRWNVQHDDRLGRVGKFIRRTSLDELPQLWNTLRGDMSLVGPRPERPHFVDSFSSALPRYLARHRVPAGVTGWAQVHGLRGDTSIEERARFDNDYIENWSLWLDIRILVMTLASVLKGSGG